MPQSMVISAEEDNCFGHPDPEMLEPVAAVGAAVLRTDELGTIEVISDVTAVWWEANLETDHCKTDIIWGKETFPCQTNQNTTELPPS